MKEKSELPPCVTCINAQRAKEGYVELCLLHQDDEVLRYGRCVQAGARGECDDYQDEAEMEKDDLKKKFRVNP